jgi:hypothetical protein
MNEVLNVNTKNMEGSVKKILAILASMLLISVAALAQQVSVNYNHSQSFAQ